jgi:hypothetical protein
VSGRRAGPFAWAVIVELAQAGALHPDDRIWRMGLAGWSRAGDLPDLAPLIREPAPSARAFASRTPDAPVGASGAPRGHPLSLAAGIVWIAATAFFYVERLKLWPNVLDGVLTARLNTVGLLLLFVIALATLPGVWHGTRPDALGRNGIVRGGIRAAAGICALLLLTTVISTALYERPLFLIAFGSDPIGRAQIQLLPGGREIEIRGTLEAGVATRLDRMLQAHPAIRFVDLNSRGGWIFEGDRLARVIHARQLGTYTATGCYSACVLAFVAGSPRVLNPDARLGLHSASGGDGDPVIAKLGNRIYQKTLLRYGASPAVVAWSTSTPASSLWMPDPQELLASHLVDRISADGFSPAGESLAAFTRQTSAFEARYPLLTELRRVDPPRLARLDQSVRLGFRRGAPAKELNGYVAAATAEIEREHLAAVADSSALRFAVALRTAARTFRSSDPAQCAAILGPRSAAGPVRSAAALAAITPALAALLAAPMTRRAAAPAAQAPPSGEADTADADSRMRCDRLLLMYDDAATQTPDTGAAFVRAMQAGGGH